MTIYIVLPLTKGHHAIIDYADRDLAAFKWTATVGSRTVYVYRTNWNKGNQKRVNLHRVILERKLGIALERKQECDHRDGNGLNNSRANLRVSTRRENMQNTCRRSDNTSGEKGVFHEDTGKWLAYIHHEGRRVNIGHFKEFQDALAARRAAEIEMFGEFSVLVSRPAEIEALT